MVEKVKLQHTTLTWDEERSIMWADVDLPYVSMELLSDIDSIGAILEDNVHLGQWQQKPVFVVFRSTNPNIFNLGGDLRLFSESVLTGDFHKLNAYANNCIATLYRLSHGWGLPVNTVAMVQGQCFGGGFESALACDYLIASDTATFGLPEVNFDLFPGMGALTFLKRRVGEKMAYEMASNGITYSALDMREWGVVDSLATDDSVQRRVEAIIQKKQARNNNTNALRKIRHKLDGVSLHDLHYIVEVWLEAVKNIDKRDIRIMNRLIVMQEKLNNV